MKSSDEWGDSQCESKNSAYMFNLVQHLLKYQNDYLRKKNICMRPLIISFILLSFSQVCLAQQEVPEATELYKEVLLVSTSEMGAPPSDAVVLFDGSSLDAFQTPQGSVVSGMKYFKDLIPTLKAEHTGDPAPWKIQNSELVVVPGTGQIATKKPLGDVQLHIEWLAPIQQDKKGQMYSNSGLLFMGMYEVQILNSYENPTYSNGQAAAVYKQHIPLVNASSPPDTWQTYEVIFMSPKFSDKGTLVAPARVTVFHNGVLVQNNVELLGPTCYIGTPYYISHPEKLPLLLQDHGDPMRFRNIWVREL
ncbi:MAG: hypothetical protein ACI8QD_000502 [Cyclobacteriaceae bacterium]|jgi:hypothetical protein